MKTPLPLPHGVFHWLVILLFFGGVQVYSENGPKNPAEEIESYRKAAEKGDAQAQFNLALSYDNGDPTDAAKAVKWCRMAAEQGHQGLFI